MHAYTQEHAYVHYVHVDTVTQHRHTRDMPSCTNTHSFTGISIYSSSMYTHTVHTYITQLIKDAHIIHNIQLHSDTCLLYI